MIHPNQAKTENRTTMTIEILTLRIHCSFVYMRYDKFIAKTIIYICI